MEKKLSVAQVKVGKRVRSDYGDVKALAASIDKVGLLQAIAITKDNRLICGERRLRAVKSLKQKTIDCRVVDVSDFREAEMAENEFRKSLTLSEKAELANAILEETGKPKTGRPKKRAQNAHVSANGEPVPLTQGELAIQAGFKGREEMGRVATTAKRGIGKLVQAMDDEKISVTKAATIANLPKAEQTKILKDAETEDGRYSFTKPSAVKAKGPTVADKVLASLEKSLARVWGIDEQFGSVAEMFDSVAWLRKENAKRIGEYADKVEELAKAYTKLSRGCRAYCKKHNI